MLVFLEILVITATVLLTLYILSTQGRAGHPGWEVLKGWKYAHRGLHDKARPENSMSAFRAALEGGYGIELDIHLLADGNLAVIHDASLKRTAGADVAIESLDTRQLAQYRLLGSEEPIPLFRDVLELFNGKAPLIVELKPVNGNHAALAEAACNLLENYNGPYCMESFDPRCIAWLKKNRPHILRGQLTERYAKSSPIPRLIKWALTHQAFNFATRPDFVAYRFADRKNFGNLLARKFWGIQGVTWTLKTQEEFDTAVKEGWIPIFEGFTP